MELSESGAGRLRSAWSLLTVLGGAGQLHPGAAVGYGLVGAVLGAGLGASWWALEQVLPALVAATVVVAIDAGLTGMLHLDGLADSADALLAPMDRPRRLAVLRTPEVGAFAVVVVALTLLLRVTALASLTPQPLLLVGLWAFARGAMAATAALLPHARPGPGLARAVAARGANRLGAGIGLGLGGAVLASLGWRGGVALAGGALAAVAVATLAHRRLGGYTGDVLGAVGVVVETVGLVAATSRG